MALLKNNPFVNIVAGSRASLNLPVNGPTYHFLLLRLVTLLVSDIERIRLQLNAKTVIDVPGELLQAMNVYKGDQTSATVLSLDFTEMLAKELADELSGVIPTAVGVSNLTVYVDIKAGATVSAGDLDSWSFVSGLIPSANPLGNIQHLIAQTHNFQGANTYDVDLPHGISSGHLIKRIWVVKKSGTGEVTAVDLRKNQLPVMETIKEINDFYLERYNGVLDTSFYCLDMVASNHTIGGLLTTKDAGDLRLKITTDNSCVCDIYIESLADLALI